MEFVVVGLLASMLYHVMVIVDKLEKIIEKMEVK